jgi:hypothetical protein
MNSRVLASLVTLLDVLDASNVTLGRDRCVDYAIDGKSGKIYQDGGGYLLYVTTGESAVKWRHIKQRLSFCRVTQDGDDEGCLHLDRLPTEDEAALIRKTLGLRKRREVSPEEWARITDRMREVSFKRVRVLIP